MTKSVDFKFLESVTIGHTPKGRRVWLQTLEAAGWPAGTRFNVAIEGDTIAIIRDAEGRRSVTNAKRGVIDIQSKRVSAWAGGAESATVFFTHARIHVVRND